MYWNIQSKLAYLLIVVGNFHFLGAHAFDHTVVTIVTLKGNSEVGQGKRTLCSVRRWPSRRLNHGDNHDCDSSTTSRMIEKRMFLED